MHGTRTLDMTMDAWAWAWTWGTRARNQPRQIALAGGPYLGRLEAQTVHSESKSKELGRSTSTPLGPATAPARNRKSIMAVVDFTPEERAFLCGPKAEAALAAAGVALEDLRPRAIETFEEPRELRASTFEKRRVYQWRLVRQELAKLEQRVQTDELLVTRQMKKELFSYLSSESMLFSEGDVVISVRDLHHLLKKMSSLEKTMDLMHRLDEAGAKVAPPLLLLSRPMLAFLHLAFSFLSLPLRACLS